MEEFKLKELLKLIELSEKGDAESQNILGARLITGSLVEPDIAGGCYWYCEAIKQGYIHAKWNLGSMLIDGEDGVRKNEKVGFRLVLEAAQGGNNSACLFLSSCYRKGKYGLIANKDVADFWEAKAWDQNSILDFNQAVDLNEYGIKFKKPNLKIKDL